MPPSSPYSERAELHGRTGGTVLYKGDKYLSWVELPGECPKGTHM